MKTLTLNLAKKLLIFDYENKQELDKIWDFYSAFGKPTTMHDGTPTKALFKGTFLTEEDYRSLIADKDGGISISKHPSAYLISYSRHKNAFKDLIEKEGFYWLENPLEQPSENDLNGSFFTMQQNFHKEKEYEEAEARTLKFPIIYEILE